jgi:hypothetical protein
MNINYSKLNEGDIWFSQRNDFISSFVKHKVYDDCGFIIKPFGGKLFYAAHIDRTGKLRFERLTDLNIILIRRVPYLFDTLEDRVKLRNRLTKMHEVMILEDLVYLGDSISMLDSEMFGEATVNINRNIDFFANNYKFITVQDGD